MIKKTPRFLPPPVQTDELAFQEFQQILNQKQISQQRMWNKIEVTSTHLNPKTQPILKSLKPGQQGCTQSL
jgi:hypothetical protein